MVNNWLQNKNYNDGIQLLEDLDPNNIFIPRFKEKQTTFFENKLENELLKFKDSSASILIQEKREIIAKKIADYPLELHSTYNKRLATFLESCSLKLQLNALIDNEEEEALTIQFKIFNLMQENKHCWKILNHYDKTQEVLLLESSSNFENLSPAELWKIKQLKYQQLSRRKNSIEKWQKELDLETDFVKKIKLEQKLLKKLNELHCIENDIKFLTKNIYL